MRIKSSIVIAVLTISLYIFISSSFEFMLTEKLLILKQIPIIYNWFTLLIIFSLVFGVVSTVNSLEKKLVSKKNFAFILAVFFISLFGKKVYTDYYRYLQDYPKIYKISQDWSIQGKMIKIEGKNFGHAYQSGIVQIGQIEFINKKWENEEVIVEQPVTSKYFSEDLILTNHKGNDSNPVNFEIKDPATLDQ